MYCKIHFIFFVSLMIHANNGKLLFIIFFLFVRHIFAWLKKLNSNATCIQRFTKEKQKKEEEEVCIH